MKRKITALLLSGALACAISIPAIAADSDSSPETAPIATEAPQPLPASVLYYGQVKEITKDENGAITRLYLESEQYGAFVMNISAETVWIDSGNRSADDSAKLEAGESVYVFHSPIATMSLPPQSAAFAVVRNIPQDAGCAQYHVVEDVAMGEDGTVTITTDNGGLYIRADKETTVSPYLTKNIVTLEDIKKGDRIMAWYDVVAESYPAQTYTDRIIVLPNSEPAEGATITLELDGKASTITGRYENGVAMIPVAAVARELGYEANYTPVDGVGHVTIESDTFAVHLTFGEELIYGATTIEGAVGMTAPQNYGAAVYVVDPGTTWAPAELFTLLGRTVTLEGGTLIIK